MKKSHEQTMIEKINEAMVNQYLESMKPTKKEPEKGTRRQIDTWILSEKALYKATITWDDVLNPFDAEIKIIEEEGNGSEWMSKPWLSFEQFGQLVGQCMTSTLEDRERIAGWVEEWVKKNRYNLLGFITQGKKDKENE